MKNNPPLIAVVDDEPDILELIRLHLARAGYTVRMFRDAGSLRVFLKTERPDLLLLDRMLPDADGLDICREVRGNPAFAGTPVIMVTARADELDRILGLEIGADDYIVKPFSPRELVARVRARLRRFGTTAGDESVDDESPLILADGGLVIDPACFEVTVDGKNITLTATEFRILRILTSPAGRTRRVGRVWRRDEILESLWGGRKMVLDRTIDVHISNLRDKLGRFGSALRNIKGVGYRFEIEAVADHSPEDDGKTLH